jgi:hypothetical protein
VIEFYAFASKNPLLTFFLAYILGKLVFKLFRQTMRSATIMKHGYPPIWCDADGDFQKPEKPVDTGKDNE